MSEGFPYCPGCFDALRAAATECAGCGLRFRLRGSVVDCIGEEPREARAAEVEDFYTRSPFPGYAPGDDAPAFLDRSRRSPFLVALDEAIGPEARVLDCGCGTAQIASFLALAAPRRRVVGVDGCRESLGVADDFRARIGFENLQLVRGDLFDLPVPERAFEVVLCRGVVHHTPDPYGAIERVAARVAPGGVLLLGIYESMGRLFHRFRRGLGALRGGRPFAVLDPVLRRKDVDEERKRIWLEDQYLHPLEHLMPLPKVQRKLDALGFHRLRTIPPAARGASLFQAAPEPSAAGLFLTRLGWVLGGVRDPDAGLVFLLARRHDS